MNKAKFLRGPLAAAIAALVSTTAVASDYSDDDREHGRRDNKPVHVEMFAPAKGDRVGIGGRGWFVDLALQYEATLEQTGFTGFQITGPAGHNNVAPFPGTFSAGADDRLPGLIVLLSTTTVGAGSCQNVANLFNLTGVTNVSAEEIELWDTWIIGAPNFGVNTESKVYVAVADDLNGDGIYNDAPGVVPDANGDGICNAKDLKAFGVASNIAKAKFFINP
jgi:hypothetical protein